MQNNKVKEFFQKPAFTSILASLICVLLGIIFGFLLLLITNPNEAFKGISSIVIYPLTPKFFNQGFMGAIAKSAPLILAGLSVLFAFKTGMFNIGAPGQMLVGGFTAVAISLTTYYNF